MQDEVREKSVALTIKVGKIGGRLTAGLLKWAMQMNSKNSIPTTRQGQIIR